jgi:hypothetical protein
MRYQNDGPDAFGQWTALPLKVVDVLLEELSTLGCQDWRECLCVRFRHSMNRPLGNDAAVV